MTESATPARRQRDYVAEVDRIMADCWKCARLTPQQREQHRQKALEQILRKQSTPPPLLPESVWAGLQ